MLINKIICYNKKNCSKYNKQTETNTIKLPTKL